MRNNWQILGLILLGWTVFFYATGLLTAGLHPDLDPYAFLGLDVYYNNGKTFYQDLKQIFQNILFNKFGFGLWGYIVFAFFSKFFGENMIGIRAFFMLLGALSFFILYLTGRQVGWSQRESLLFPAVLMFGVQFWIWYNMCGEPVGVFFSSLTFLSLSIAANKNSVKWLLFSLLGIIATSLSKESFILLLPAFVLFYAWRLSVINNFTWKQLIFKILPLAIPTALVFLAEIAYILIYLGANARGVGVSINTPVSLYISVFFNFFASNTVYIYLFSGCFLLLTLITWKNLLSHVTTKGFLIFFLFLLAILLPQVILHAQSGWVTRYLFPALFANAFALTAMLHELQVHKEYYRFYTLSLLLLIAAEMMPKVSDNPEQAFRHLRNYVSTCHATEALLKTVVAQSDSDDMILIVSNPADRYVWPASIQSMFRSLYDRKNISRLAVVPAYEYDDVAQKQINSMKPYNEAFEKRDKEKIQHIVLMPFIERLFLKEHKGWFDPASYERHTFWRFVYYRKKNN
ncbi:ArnT family glycosyltransferase [Rhodoflexus sp.]